MGGIHSFSDLADTRRQPSAARPRRTPLLGARTLISVAVIALTSLIAASNLLDVYGSAAMWAVAAVPATLLGALIAYAGYRTRACAVVADRVPDRCAGRHRPGRSR